MSAYEERLKRLDGQYTKLEKQLSDIVKKLAAYKPYSGKQLILNDNLDVLKLNNRITGIEKRSNNSRSASSDLPLGKASEYFRGNKTLAVFATDVRAALSGIGPIEYNYDTGVISHASGNGYNHIPSDGADGEFLKYDTAGAASWSALTAADIPPLQTSAIIGLDTRLGVLEAADGDLQSQIDALFGAVIFIGTIALNTPDVTQDALNARAAELGKTPLRKGYCLIDSGANDWWYDGGAWVNIGYYQVAQATNTNLGVVKGSVANLKISVDGLGEMSVNGLQTALDGKQAALNRAVGGNDDATGTVTDIGGNLSVPIQVTTVAPTANATIQAAGTRSLRSSVQGLIDNVQELLNRANTSGSGSFVRKSGDTMTGALNFGFDSRYIGNYNNKLQILNLSANSGNGISIESYTSNYLGYVQESASGEPRHRFCGLILANDGIRIGGYSENLPFSYNYTMSNPLSGSSVISQLNVQNGLITRLNTRSLSASDIGAASASHTHSYLPISGGTLTGALTGNYTRNNVTGLHLGSTNANGNTVVHGNLYVTKASDGEGTASLVIENDDASWRGNIGTGTGFIKATSGVVSFDNSTYVKTSGNSSTVSLGRFGGAYIDTFRGATALSFNDSYNYDGDYARGFMSWRVKNGDGYSLLSYQGDQNNNEYGRALILGYATNSNINAPVNTWSPVMAFRDGYVTRFRPYRLSVSFTGSSTVSNTASYPAGFGKDNCFVLGFVTLPATGDKASCMSGYVSSVNLTSNGVSVNRPSTATNVTFSVDVFLMRFD